MNSSNLDARNTPEWRQSLQGKKRVRRDQRPKNPKGMYLTENDRAIVRLVYDYRILSQRQLEQLLGKSRGTVQEKLIRLFHHQFLDRIFMPVVPGIGRSPTLYVLDKQGIALLRHEGIEDFSGLPSKRGSSFFFEHTLAINDVRIAMSRACQERGWRVAEWRDENAMKADYDRVRTRTRSGRTLDIPILPDSYFVIEIPDRGVSHFFLELDRGTMTQERFRQKLVGYVAYHKVGGYERRFKSAGLRVLTVTDKPGRFPKLVESARSVEGIGRRFWFAQLEAVTASSVLTEPVWTVAGSDDKATLFSG